MTLRHVCATNRSVDVFEHFSIVLQCMTIPQKLHQTRVLSEVVAGPCVANHPIEEHAMASDAEMPTHPSLPTASPASPSRVTMSVASSRPPAARDTCPTTTPPPRSTRESLGSSRKRSVPPMPVGNAKLRPHRRAWVPTEAAPASASKQCALGLPESRSKHDLSECQCCQSAVIGRTYSHPWMRLDCVPACKQTPVTSRSVNLSLNRVRLDQDLAVTDEALLTSIASKRPSANSITMSTSSPSRSRK